MLDINRVRADCTACDTLIHFNNAGCALSPDAVSAAVLSHLQSEQQLGGYEAAARATPALQFFYTAMAELLNCRPMEIAFVENATRAWELALHSIDFAPGDEIITARNEYASNYLALLQLARRKQLKLHTVPLDRHGLVDLQELTDCLSPRTKLIALTHLASQRGDLQPAAEVGRLARQHGALFLLDACQSAGQIVLDVQALNCDFLAGTGRKYLRGPRGTGFLYVREARLAELDPVFVDLHAARWTGASDFEWHEGARRFENFERFVAGQIGLGVAVDYANTLGLHAIQERIQSLAALLHDELSALPEIQVLERSPAQTGIVTFSSARQSAQELRTRLHSNRINVSVAKHENARLDLDQEGRGDVCRASVHYYNTETEIQTFLRVVRL